MGWTDNLVEVAKALRSQWEEGEPLTLIWVYPSSDLFRAAQAAKARDYVAEGHREDDPWVLGWQAKASLSDKDVKSFIEGKLNLIIEKIKPEEVIIIHNDAAKDVVKAGWHDKDVKPGSAKVPVEKPSKGAKPKDDSNPTSEKESGVSNGEVKGQEVSDD
jgi:hypothetical protein